MLSSLCCYQVYRACLTVDKADMGRGSIFLQLATLRYLSGSRSQNQISMKTDDVARFNSIGTCCSLPTVVRPGSSEWNSRCKERVAQSVLPTLLAYSVFSEPPCHSRVHTIQRRNVEVHQDASPPLCPTGGHLRLYPLEAVLV
jgi:hypothetical protein